MSTKITEATLTNFQKVSYAKIVPSGNLIVLAGKNGAGKTSTNDGLEAGMCGHNGRNIKRPIKDGHGKASIEIKLSDGSTLIRGYTPSGTTLKGKDADGKKFGQSELNGRLSSLGIDGRRFMEMDEPDRLKALLSVVDLPFKPAELEASRKAIEAKRLFVGQQGKAIGDVEVNAGLPTEETSVAELVKERGNAESIHHQHRVEDTAVQGWGEKIERLRAEIVEAEKELTAAVARKSALPDAPELDYFIRAIDSAEESNAAIRANNAARRQWQEKETLRAEYNAFTDEIKAIDKTKADGLAAASKHMPIEGLAFDDEGVLYQGIPYSRAAGAEKGIVSLAMTMATNPEIRVATFRDGNIFDMESLQIVQAMAEATDFQVFIEIVADAQGDQEFYFVDGELAA